MTRQSPAAGSVVSRAGRVINQPVSCQGSARLMLEVFGPISSGWAHPIHLGAAAVTGLGLLGGLSLSLTTTGASGPGGNMANSLAQRQGPPAALR